MIDIILRPVWLPKSALKVCIQIHTRIALDVHGKGPIVIEPVLSSDGSL